MSSLALNWEQHICAVSCRREEKISLDTFLKVGFGDWMLLLRSASKECGRTILLLYTGKLTWMPALLHFIFWHTACFWSVFWLSGNTLATLKWCICLALKCCWWHVLHLPSSRLVTLTDSGVNLVGFFLFAWSDGKGNFLFLDTAFGSSVPHQDWLLCQYVWLLPCHP